jgi:hypothetical protein
MAEPPTNTNFSAALSVWKGTHALPALSERVLTLSFPTTNPHQQIDSAPLSAHWTPVAPSHHLFLPPAYLSRFPRPSITRLRRLRLSTLQRTLDTQGLEIVENQKDATLGRKRLAEQTRGASLYSTLFAHYLTDRGRCAEFKKVPDDEKGPAFKTLLKGTSTFLPREVCSWAAVARC